MALQGISEAWLHEMAAAYADGGVAAALASYDGALESQAASLQGRPSTYIMASEVLHACGADAEVCADVLFNVLETKLPDTQCCRVVAYHLLSYGCFDDAIRLLELVRETLAPAEPHSYTDLAFARFHRLRHRSSGEAGVAEIRGEMRQVISDLTKVVVGTEWASRYAEIEWPVLILLSWAVAWAEHRLSSSTAGDAASAREGGNSLWPEEQLPAAKYRLGGPSGPQLDVFCWLGWDTDHTDVDLHVKEPTGEEVYYGHRRSRSTGAHVSRDFTDGYGPEVYTLHKAPKGSYMIETNYYASHQASTSTGSTSAVIWTVERMGRFGEETVQFNSVRLTKHKQRQQVLQVEV
jgi:Ca-activated chloride channel family protein